MDGRAVSGGLLPLASGVMEANCDFRLEGTLPGTVAWRGGLFLGGAGCAGTGVTLDVRDGGTAAGESACGNAEAGAVTVELEGADAATTGGATVVCGVPVDGASGLS